MAENVKKRWVEEEIKFLRENYGKLSPSECAKILGRTYHSTKQKAVRLGLGKERKAFTDYEIAYINKHYSQEGPIAIGKVLGRHHATINSLAQKIGIKMTKQTRGILFAKNHLGRKRPQSTKDKISAKAKLRVRDKNPNWKGGITKLETIVRRLLIPIWAFPIMQRDDYICQCCGSSTDLCVHHGTRFTKIRDEVLSEYPMLPLDTYDDRLKVAKLIAIEHKLSDGITLCARCHKIYHSANRVNCGDILPGDAEDNPQPSPSNVRKIVDGKVQRLIGEDVQSNKPDTSALLSLVSGDR